MGRGLLCQGLREWRRICRDFLCGRVRNSVRLSVLLPALGGLFLFQQSFHTAPRLIGPTGGGILDLVTAVVAGLPPLGGLSELATQAFSSVI